MKKTLILLIILVVIQESASSQNRTQDVVYLKNGSIIRGLIVEQIPNVSLKIETADRNVFVFKMEEIEKFTKESVSRNWDVESLENRQNFVGISFGASIPMGAYADDGDGLAKAGLQLNLINIGYLFNENIGLTATWFGAANPLKYTENIFWSYGGLMIGPLLSYPVSRKLSWDFKPMVGYAVTTAPDLFTVIERSNAFAFSIGSQLRNHLSPRASILLGADYLYTNYNTTQF